MVLDSLRRQTFTDFEVIVVDNGSRDRSLELLHREYPEVRVVALSENRGFSGGCNAGILASRGEMVALVNNDVELDPFWLQALVEGMDQEPRAGFAASRIRQYWNRNLLDSAGDRVGLSPEGRGQGHPDGPEFDRPAWVTSACCAAAIYRRTMLDEVGLFNEDFFAYFEDVELGMRCQIAGYRCLYIPTAVVYHIGSATSARIPRFKVYHGLRNMVYLYFTTFPVAYVIRHLPRLMVAKSWFVMREGGFWTGLKAGSAVIWNTPRMLRRRRRTFALRRVSDQVLETLLDPPRPLSLALLREKLLGDPPAAPTVREEYGAPRVASAGPTEPEVREPSAQTRPHISRVLL